MLKNAQFKNIMHNHAKELLEFLINNNYRFSIVVNVTSVKFNPILPKELSDEFKLPVLLFDVGGYTLDSSRLENDTLTFEAGFGPDDFASTVSIPADAIIQILYKKIPIFINPSDQAEVKEEDEDKKRQKSKKIFSLDN